MSLQKRSVQVLVAFIAILFAWAYFPTMLELFQVWGTNPDYQHGFLVIPLAGFILWRRRNLFPKSIQSGVIGGCLLLVVAGALRTFSARFFFTEFDPWSIPIWLGGIIWLFGGASLFRWAAPALFFLFFMAPLPQRVELALSLPLQIAAANGSAWVLQVLGCPAVVNGTTVMLGTETVDIERACCGLRMLFSTFAMAFAYVFLGQTSSGITKILLLASIPVAIMANILRIVITALMYQFTTDGIGRRVEHDFAGFIVIFVVLVTFTWLIWQLTRWSNCFQSNSTAFSRRIIVWPFVTILTVFAIFFLHHRQVVRTIDDFTTLSDVFRESGDYENAKLYLDYIIRLKPDADFAYEKLADIELNLSDDPKMQLQALGYLNRASRRNPENLDLIVRRAELAEKLNNVDAVVQAAREILKHDDIAQSKHASLRKRAIRWNADGIYAQLQTSDSQTVNSWTTLFKALEEAIKMDPLYPQHAFRYALVQRTKILTDTNANRIKKADRTIDQMLERNADNPEAWLVRYRYRLRFLEDDSADEVSVINADLDRAIELQNTQDTKNVHIFVAAAERARRSGHIEASVSFYEKAIDANPRDARPYLGISEMVHDPNLPTSRAKAIVILEHGIQAIGKRELPLLLPLVEHLFLNNETEKAEEYLKAGRKEINAYSDPLYTTYHIQLVNLEAWMLAHQNRFGDAADFLSEQIQQVSKKQVRNHPSVIAQAWGNVGQYYRRAGNWEKASDAYKQAAMLDDLWRTQFRLSRAQQNEIAGKLKLAAKEYEELATTSDDPKSSWFNAALLSLREQLMLPTSHRDWTQFRRALESARSFANGIDADIVTLDANQLVIVGDASRAEEILLAAIRTQPKSITLRRALALFYSKHQGDMRTAIAWVNDIQVDETNRLNVAMLKSEIFVSGKQYEDARKTLSDAITSSDNNNDRSELNLVLADLEIQLGNWNDAKDRLVHVIPNGSNSVRIAETISQLAWCQRDWKSLAECEMKLKEIEGESGALWRTCRIRRIIGESSDQRRKSNEMVDEVTDLAAQLRSLHPNRQLTQISAASVATFRGLLWEAVADYEKAWGLGVPRISMAVDLIGLLNELGQTERAQRYVDEARSYMLAGNEVIDRSIIDLGYESDIDAIRFAEAWVNDHHNSEGFLRLGRTLALTAIPNTALESDRLEKARVAFEEAVELDPKNIRAWGAKFRFFAAARPDPAKARRVLKELESSSGVRELDRIFGSAQMQESIGQFDIASDLYRQSVVQVEEEGDRLSRLVVNERAAQFFQTHDINQAIECCETALSIDKSSLGARHVMIGVLLKQGTQESIARADSIFEEITFDGTLSEAAKRFKARILFAKAELQKDGGTFREQAIAILRELVDPNSEDGVMLVKLMMANRQFTAAANELTRIVNDPEYQMDPIADFLLENVDLTNMYPAFMPAVQNGLLRLEETKGLELISLNVRLRRLKSNDKPASKLKDDTSFVISQFAQRSLLRNSDADEQSRIMRETYDFLVKNRQIEFAINLANIAPPPGTRKQWGVAFAQTLAANNDVEIPVEESERILSKLVAANPEDAEVYFSIANYRYMQGSNEEAIRLYKMALELAPNQPTIINNLALAVSELDENSERSQQLLESALEENGPVTELLDSLALQYIKSGQPEKAKQTLNTAIPIVNPQKTMLLHLAKAHSMSGEFEEARLIHRSIGQLSNLSPVDREIYDSLVQELDAKNP